MKVTIKTSDGRNTLTAMLGENAPETTDGRGGWTEVARPRRPAVLEWTGPGLRKATIEVVLDAWISGGSVDHLERVIDALAPKSPTVETPTVLVTGCPGVLSTVPWVIQTAVPSARLLTETGTTARVTYTLELLERRTADVTVVRADLAKRSVARNGTAATKAKPRTHTVTRGETLSSIAAKVLGKASRWTEIAKLNSIRTPTAIRVGQVLRLP